MVWVPHFCAEFFLFIDLHLGGIAGFFKPTLAMAGNKSLKIAPFQSLFAIFRPPKF